MVESDTPHSPLYLADLRSGSTFLVNFVFNVFHATIQYIHVSIDICANKIEVPVRMVDIHLIFVRFNGKLAITDRDLYHSAALVCGELGVFSEMFM